MLVDREAHTALIFFFGGSVPITGSPPNPSWVYTVAIDATPAVAIFRIAHQMRISN